MNDFIMLTCRSCGGKLQITPELENFACMYCGTEYQVKREGGVVALNPLVDEIKKVSVSTDKTASELAIMRLNNELVTLNDDLINEKNKYDEYKKIQENEIQNNKQTIRDRKILIYCGDIFYIVLYDKYVVLWGIKS